MNFEIDEKLSAKLDTINQFVQEKLFPIENEIIYSDYFEVEPRIKALRDEVKKMGLWAPHIPQSIGGSGENLMQLGLMSEILGQSPLGHLVFGCQAPDAGNIELLHMFGSDEQKERWMLPLANGDIRSCFGMTEPATAGSNPTLLEATAELDGDEWVINAHKWFTSAADGAAFCIAMVVTNPNAAKHERASMIIVPTDTPGYKMVRNIQIMGEAGSGFYSHAEVKMENCRVPASNLIGEAGSGFKLAQERLGPGRIHHCMRWLGICRRAMNEMIDYVKIRKITDKYALANMQAIQNWIAESQAEIESARTLVLQTAWKIENIGFEKAKTDVSMIKYHTAGVLQKVVDRSIQAHGGLGVTDDKILAYFFRHERAARIYDGPDEVHKMVVARQLLK
ncbi:MAG: acyl-CoA dehydrogenase family protein [Gammaproteobacteria bacterium]|nr:acyl-CoA dehydrogenase family protein [Gammaproteobacteria bacterium]